MRTDMQVTIESVPFDRKQVFAQLLQLYLYDSSEYDGWDITEQGYFRYGYVDHYWTEEGRFPFFIRVKGRLAGLAMVRTATDGETGARYHSLAEFFVMRTYRGKGVGKAAATRLLDMFPGVWRVGESSSNKPAQAFWRKLIADYSGGKFTDQVLPDEDFPWLRGPVQQFSSHGRTLVYLVRHGHSPTTPDERGRPLSGQGERDARLVAEYFEGENPDVIYSSPYRRAIQTVEPLALQAGLEIKTREELRERTLGEHGEDFDVALLRCWKNFALEYPGGESNAGAQARGVAALTEILTQEEGKRVAIGTHGTLMSLIMNHYDPENYGYQFSRNLDAPDIYLLVFQGTDYRWSMRLWQRRR